MEYDSLMAFVLLNGPRAREGAIWPPLEEKKLPEGEWRTLRV